MNVSKPRRFKFRYSALNILTLNILTLNILTLNILALKSFDPNYS